MATKYYIFCLIKYLDCKKKDFKIRCKSGSSKNNFNQVNHMGIINL